MFKKPEREFLSYDAYKAGMAAAGRIFFQEYKAKKAYMAYLQWYRSEMTLYREKMRIVKSALSKLTLDEQDTLRLYWKT